LQKGRDPEGLAKKVADVRRRISKYIFSGVIKKRPGNGNVCSEYATPLALDKHSVIHPGKRTFNKRDAEVIYNLVEEMKIRHKSKQKLQDQDVSGRDVN